MGHNERVSSTSTATPVGQPLHGASFGQAVKRFFQGYVKFAGRASRSEFWWAMLFTSIVALLASIPYWIAFGAVMARAAETQGSAVADSTALTEELAALTGSMLLGLGLLFVVSLAFLLPTYAVMWRRLQDANFHGAFTLLNLVGVGIVPLIMCFLPSNPAGARFDPGHAGQLDVAYGQPYPAAPYGHAAPFGQAAPYGDPAAYAPPQPSGQHAAPVQPPPYGQPQSYSGMQYDGQPYGQPSAPVDGQPPAEPRAQP